MMRVFIIILLFCGLCAAGPVQASGTLTGNQLISSEYLGYDLQYRVYLPEGYETLENLPVLYVTDGQWYINQGEMHLTMDEEIAKGRIKPVIGVFVDNRDPHNLSNNRRNREFFCNRQYAQFFQLELVQKIDAEYKTQVQAPGRVILGVSFGGLNSACFGVYAYPTFGGIAMHSPALHPVHNLYDMYVQSGVLPIKIFLSTGTVNDNTVANRKWHKLLKKLGYDVHYREVKRGHTWQNWRLLMDDVLQTFFPKDND